MKKTPYILLSAWLLLILSGIAYLFWQNELRYSLPTPIPRQYSNVKQGEYVNIDAKIKGVQNKPVFIHFFNPSCPCSRFNIPHFKTLQKLYGGKISFAIVVLNKNKLYTAEEIQEKFNLKIPVYFDESIATATGVYSTPQAVLLDDKHCLYYRGNYNKSRYCTDPNSNYAQLAIDDLLNNKHNPIYSAFATKAYGCELPLCKR